MSESKRMRIEKDCLGEVEVPAEAYYGVQSVRAMRNFPISGLRMNPYMIRAAGGIKKAAALVNAARGRLRQEVAEGIVQAAEELRSLQLAEQVVVVDKQFLELQLLLEVESRTQVAAEVVQLQDLHRQMEMLVLVVPVLS